MGVGNMWNVSNKSMKFANGGIVKPVKVLYQFDGPLLFTALMGGCCMLFFNYDTVGDNDLFIATHSDARMINALESGVMAVREALGIGDCIVVELDTSGRIHNYWQTRINHLDQELMPEFGVCLDAVNK